MSSVTESNQPSQTLKQAGRMGVATLLSRILGLVREQVFAFLFGATDAADAFNIAFRIPNLLRDLFAEGAMSAAFVPNFTRALLESRRKAFELLTAVLTLLFSAVGLLSIAGIIYSDRLVKLYAGAYQNVAGKIELAAQLSQIMFPFFPLVAMAAVLMGALNALGAFFLPAFAPVLFNVFSILAGLVLCPLLSRYSQVPPIFGMAVGVVVGGFFQFYIQWWQVRRLGFKLSEFSKIILNPWRIPEVKTVLWLMIPGTIGLAATQLGILINSIYATESGSGAVSWLNYAFRLMQFPIGIFGVSLAAATLPQAAKKIAQNQPQQAMDEVRQSLKMSFAVNAPATAGLISLALPIVQMLFQHGKFSYSDAQATSHAVAAYALGLLGYSAVKILVPIFYAIKDTRVPLLTSFAMVGLSAFLNHWFILTLHRPFWFLALATTATATCNALLLVVILHYRFFATLINRDLVLALMKHLILNIVLGLATWRLLLWSQNYFQEWQQTRWLFWFLQVTGGGVFLIGFWLIFGYLFKIDENKRAAQYFFTKIPKRFRIR